MRKVIVLATLMLALMTLATFPFLMLSQGAVSETVVNENSIEVYVVSLDDVGNFRASNRSMVVEGVIQATNVHKFYVLLGFGRSAEVNVTVNFSIIHDWDMYKSLVESGSNIIIVDAHDEYLPVPSNYTKEEWVDKIADFMLNRWGTWVHLGGYPFNLIWHQSGQTEIWAEDGFKTLMSYIGKGDVTCNCPSDENKKADIILNGPMVLGSWYWWDGRHSHSLGTFARASVGRPLKYDDFKEYCILPLYEWTDSSTGKLYWPCATIRLSGGNGKFGIYVHMGTWQFYDASDHEFWEFNDFATGFISTAATIWSEAGWPILKIHEASDAIQQAKREGRTEGLVQAETLLQKAIDTYNQAKYKESVVYSDQAAETAQNALEVAAVPYLIYGLVIVATIMGGAGAYFVINNKRRNKKCEVRKV